MIVRRRVIPIASVPAAAKSGPVRRNVQGNRDELRKKMAELIVAKSDEPSPESAAYIIKKYRDKVRSPLTAIRAKCIECSNGYLVEVRDCPVTKCALHPFRMGSNPFHAKSKARLEGSSEEGHEDEAETEVDAGDEE